MMMMMYDSLLLNHQKHFVTISTTNKGVIAWYVRAFHNWFLHLAQQCMMGLSGCLLRSVLCTNSRVSTNISLNLGNGTRLGHSYCGTPIGTCMHLSNGDIANGLEWPWVTFEGHCSHKKHFMVNIFKKYSI